jgi:hypothetical protein
MSDEPFGRQPRPVTITISGTDDRDIEPWVTRLKRGCEYKGDDTSQVRRVKNVSAEFTIYPRAVND